MLNRLTGSFRAPISFCSKYRQTFNHVSKPSLAVQQTFYSTSKYALTRPKHIKNRVAPSTVLNETEKKIELAEQKQFVLPRNVNYKLEEKIMNFVFTEKTMEDIRGYEEHKEIFIDYIEYLQDPEKFKKKGLKPLKGFILSGPPGVGKTFLAEVIAGQAGVPFYLISGAEFQGTIIGESEMIIRELFTKATLEAQKKGSCVVVCIDEIDAIGKRITDPNPRNSTHAYYINSAINQFLTLLSQEHPGVIFIGTTNHFDLLDPALVRAGRFDRHIVLSLPNSAERKKILELHSLNKKLAPDVCFKELAAISVNFSGAKLAHWVNEAALLASKEKNDEITLTHFDKARTLIQHGVVGKSNENIEIRQHTAIHESGHVLVGHILNQRLHKVSIRQYGQSMGITEWIDQNCSTTEQYLLDLICTALAGRAAEIVSGIRCLGARGDFERAKALAIEMVNNEAMGSTIIGSSLDVERILQEQLARAVKIIKTHQDTWNRLVETLIEYEDLYKEDICRIFDGHPITRKVEQSDNLEEKVLSFPPPKISPFIVKYVAAALELDVNSIQEIESYKDGCKIILKADFKEQKFIELQTSILNKNHIANRYYSSLNELIIQSYGMSAFTDYLNKFHNRSSPEITAIEEQNKPNFLITKEDIARTLGVKMSEIRSVEPFFEKGCKILFSDYLDEKTSIEKMSELLTSYNIKNKFHEQILFILPESLENFSSFVKKVWP